MGRSCVIAAVSLHANRGNGPATHAIVERNVQPRGELKTIDLELLEGCFDLASVPPDPMRPPPAGQHEEFLERRRAGRRLRGGRRDARGRHRPEGRRRELAGHGEHRAQRRDHQRRGREREQRGPGQASGMAQQLQQLTARSRTA